MHVTEQVTDNEYMLT